MGRPRKPKLEFTEQDVERVVRTTLDKASELHKKEMQDLTDKYQDYFDKLHNEKMELFDRIIELKKLIKRLCTYIAS